MIKLSEIKQIHPSKLKKNPLNADYFKAESSKYFAQLMEDIELRGILVPLIAKKDGTLLAGHNRLIVAKRLGLATVPVQYVESKLTEKQEAEMLCKDNLLRRHLNSDQRKELYQRIYHDLHERLDHKRNPVVGVDVDKIHRETGIAKQQVTNDLAKMRLERLKKEASERGNKANARIIEAYKRSLARILNLCMVEQPATVDEIIEITKNTIKRLEGMRLTLVKIEKVRRLK